MFLFASDGGGQVGIGLLFWLIFILGFIFGGYRGRDNLGGWFADSLFWWVLIFCLGLGVFGFLIHF